jgi:hypothetical protein
MLLDTNPLSTLTGLVCRSSTPSGCVGKIGDVIGKIAKSSTDSGVSSTSSPVIILRILDLVVFPTSDCPDSVGMLATTLVVNIDMICRVWLTLASGTCTFQTSLVVHNPYKAAHDRISVYAYGILCKRPEFDSSFW